MPPADPSAADTSTAETPAVDLPGPPAPIRAEVRAIPVLNPVAIAVAGLVYGLVLAALLSLWWGLGRFLDLPAPPVSLRTALSLWLAGIGLAVARDAGRKAQTTVTITPGWIHRSFGSESVTVPREEIERVRLRTSPVDRLAGTVTVDVYDETGHRMRLPRVADPAAMEAELGALVDESKS